MTAEIVSFGGGLDVSALRPSAQSRVAAAMLHSTVRVVARPIVVSPPTVTLARTALNIASETISPRRVARMVVRTDAFGGRVHGEWLGELPLAGEKIVYYLHGSGYLVCSPATHRNLVHQVGRAIGRSAFVLDYRLGPKYHFPTANVDAVRGYKWLLDQGFNGSDILVAGDSAGGHMALGLLHDLKARGLPMPEGVVAFSPLVDGSFRLGAEQELIGKDPWFTSRTALRGLKLYFRGADIDDPRYDVRNVAASDLPPILIQAGGREMMSADARAFAAAMEDVGGHCEVQIWPGQVHVFQALHSFLPEARMALKEVRRFVRSLEARAAVADEIEISETA